MPFGAPCRLWTVDGLPLTAWSRLPISQRRVWIAAAERLANVLLPPEGHANPDVQGRYARIEVFFASHDPD